MKSMMDIVSVENDDKITITMTISLGNMISDIN